VLLSLRKNVPAAFTMLDTLRTVPTPEGIELSLKVAGPMPRARAWLLDLLIRLAILFVLGVILGALGRVGSGLMVLIAFVLEWAYPVLFEVLRQGQTPGKRACDLRVLHEDGTPVQWRASVARNLIRAVDFLPVFYGFGLMAMLLNRDFKRLGDLAAGTIVVHTQRKRPGNSMPLADMASANPAPNVSLALAEQRAVIDFAERRATWSTERANELAGYAEPVLPPMAKNDTTDAATRVVRLANFLVGRR
jgi:uncharacterized RDD family membrane protein YckC